MQTEGAEVLPPFKLKVASPCPVEWDSMQGDEEVRHCSMCRKNVYNLSRLTRDEAYALMMEREGNVCVTFYEREDGTVLTEDCPVGLALAKRKLARRLARAAGAVLAVGSLAVGAFEAGEMAESYESEARTLPGVGAVLEWLHPTQRKPDCASAPKRAGESSTRKNITGFASQSTSEGS